MKTDDEKAEEMVEAFKPLADMVIQLHYPIGQKVWTGVFVAGDWQRMAAGIVTAWHQGYYDVDIMGIHGGNPWITQHVHLEERE